MAIKFSQFNLRTDHTSGMYLVGYDGNQNIHITVDNLFDDFINGTENTIAMFGTDGTALADSILSQDAGATILTVAGQLNVDAAATFDTSVTVTGDSTLNGNVILGDASTDLITQTGTLYLNGPIKDTTNTLGIDEQILVSDAIGELTFRDLYNTTVGRAEAVVQTIKCNEAIPKGCPVYIVGFQPGENANIVEKADASNPAKMPATGVADEDYAAQDFGTMTAFGSFNGDFDTTGGTENWAIGDILYVKSGGGLTNIKPTGTNLIQNIAIVSRVQSQTGEMEVIALGRTNDIPNLTPGRLWVGSTGNTIESQTLFVDEANTQVGIGTASPGQNLHINESAANTVSYLRFSNAQTTNGFDIGVNTSNSAVFFNRDVSPMVFATSNSERMRIDSSGNVGIGTTSPSAKLVVVGEIRSNKTANGVSFSSTGGGASFTAFDVYTATNGGLLRLYDQNGQTVAIDARTDTATRHTYFNGGGNVGIGTTSPAGKLEVNGGTGVATSGGTLIVRQDGDTSNDGIALTSSNSISHRMFKNAGGTFLMGPSTNSEAFALDLNGNVGIGTTSPGAKLDVNGEVRFNTNTGTTPFYVTRLGLIGESLKISVSDQDAIFESIQDESLDNYGGFQFRLDSGTTEPDFQIRKGTDPALFLVNGGGNVGIGTTTPGEKLEVNGTIKTSTGLIKGANASAYINLDGAVGSRLRYGNQYLTANATNLVFSTNNNVRMTVTNAGDVGIGITSPASKLQVNTGTDINAQIGLDSFGSFKLGDISNNYAGRGIYYDGTPGSEDLDVFTSTFNIAGNSGEGIKVVSGGDVQLLSPAGVVLTINGTTSNVGIGTTSPSHPLSVFANPSDGQIAKYKRTSNGGAWLELENNSGGFGLGTSGSEFYIYDRNNSAYGLTINSSDNVGIGTTSPASKLDVNGGIRMADDSSTASASNVGTLRYRASGNNSYVDMCMQTGASTYAWVNIVQNNW